MSLLECSLCGEGCTGCNSVCNCKFDSLKVYIANKVVEAVPELTEEDKQKVKDLIFEGNDKDYIIEYISGDRKALREKEIIRIAKLRKEEFKQKTIADREIALNNCDHVFENGFGDGAECKYCKNYKFYITGTVCAVRQEALKKGWITE